MHEEFRIVQAALSDVRIAFRKLGVFAGAF